jgi:IS4 transposase
MSHNTETNLPSAPLSTLEDVPEWLLNDELFAPIRAIVETAGITRKCQILDDLTFATLCVLRVLHSSKTGRDFLQTHGIPACPELTRGSYFKNLSSKRRLNFMRQLAAHLNRDYLPALRAFDDQLASFSELDGWQVWAADGHKISHATHDERNAKDQYTPINGIYRLEMRTGYAEFLTFCEPTERGVEHEIKALKGVTPAVLRCGAAKGQSTLLVYDRAIVDFIYAYNLKQSKSIYICTQWKENLAPMTTTPRAFDRDHPANRLVISDETVYFNNTPGPWRKITSYNADNGEIFITLTNEMTLPPGVLSELYRLRWNIEKAFDQQEQKLDEEKAWATSDEAKEIQAIAICIAHNLLHILKATLKTEEGIEDTKVIKAYHKQLDQREESAKKAGRTFPRALYQALYRPTEVSLQFIRWIRVSIIRATRYKEAIAQLRPLMLQYL